MIEGDEASCGPGDVEMVLDSGVGLVSYQTSS